MGSMDESTIPEGRCCGRGYGVVRDVVSSFIWGVARSNILPYMVLLCLIFVYQFKVYLI